MAHINTAYPREVRRIAIVGGVTFDAAALEDFLYKIHAKYPHATIVTGDGRGAEQQTKKLYEAIGQPLHIPPLQPERFGKQALDCQINDILIDADVVILVGAPGSRSKIASDIMKRMNGPRNPWNVIPIFQIASLEKPKREKKPRVKARD